MKILLRTLLFLWGSSGLGAGTPEEFRGLPLVAQDLQPGFSGPLLGVSYSEQGLLFLGPQGVWAPGSRLPEVRWSEALKSGQIQISGDRILVFSPQEKRLMVFNRPTGHLVWEDRITRVEQARLRGNYLLVLYPGGYYFREFLKKGSRQVYPGPRGTGGFWQDSHGEWRGPGGPLKPSALPGLLSQGRQRIPAGAPFLGFWKDYRVYGDVQGTLWIYDRQEDRTLTFKGIDRGKYSGPWTFVAGEGPGPGFHNSQGFFMLAPGLIESLWNYPPVFDTTKILGVRETEILDYPWGKSLGRVQAFDEVQLAGDTEVNYRGVPWALIQKGEKLQGWIRWDILADPTWDSRFEKQTGDRQWATDKVTGKLLLILERQNRTKGPRKGIYYVVETLDHQRRAYHDSQLQLLD